MHAEAQNLVAACSNCLSLVVWFHGNTSRKAHRAPGNFSTCTRKPYHIVPARSKKIACLESRHKEKPGANRYRVFQASDH
jgi:hypothetical protein